MKLLHNARQAAATPIPPRAELAAFGEAMRLRNLGSEQAAYLSAVLFPEDDDG